MPFPGRWPFYVLFGQQMSSYLPSRNPSCRDNSPHVTFWHLNHQGILLSSSHILILFFTAHWLLDGNGKLLISHRWHPWCLINEPTSLAGTEPYWMHFLLNSQTARRALGPDVFFRANALSNHLLRRASQISPECLMGETVSLPLSISNRETFCSIILRSSW